jgi:hypothetical protein
MDRSTRELLVRSIFFSIQKNNFKQKVKDEPSRKCKKKKNDQPKKVGRQVHSQVKYKNGAACTINLDKPLSLQLHNQLQTQHFSLNLTSIPIRILNYLNNESQFFQTMKHLS